MLKTYFIFYILYYVIHEGKQNTPISPLWCFLHSFSTLAGGFFGLVFFFATICISTSKTTHSKSRNVIVRHGEAITPYDPMLLMAKMFLALSSRKPISGGTLSSGEHAVHKPHH